MALTTSPVPEVGETSRTTPRAPRQGVLGVVGAGAFTAPAFILIAAFLIFPACWVIYLGLRNYNLTGLLAAHPTFAGIDNYQRVLQDPEFRHSLWVTFIFVLGSAAIGQAGLGFFLAWTLRYVQIWIRRIIEVLVIISWIIPSAIVAFLWIAMLDQDQGTLNKLLGGIHVAWLFNWPLLSIVVFNIWRGTAFSMLLFESALTTIPPSYLETARLAGASNFQQITGIVLPRIQGHILTNLLLISLWTFNDFTPYLITAGGPGFATDILPVFIYRTAITQGNLGYGAAASTIMLVINLIVALGYLRLLRRRGAQ